MQDGKKSIFRKVSLDRLSSPEQLDQLMHVTGLHSWIALFGLLLLLVASVVWGFEGSIPSTVAGEGAIVRQGGILNVVTRGSGVLLEIDVQVGERVQANQIVARVGQPAMVEKMRLAREMLAKTRRERDEFLTMHTRQANLKVAANERHRQNDERQIQELQGQATLAKEQIRVADDLLAKGLMTRQQTISARQNLENIQRQIAAQEADLKQLDAERSEIESKPVESDSEMRLRISEQEQSLAEMEKEFEINSSVISPYAGEVIELKAYPGGTVAAEAPVLSIQPDNDNLEVLAYVPSLRAKEVRAGMEAQISPSIIKREEFGFVRGKVVHVADFPSTKAALMRNFENDALVTALTASGPVTEIEVRMVPSSKTPSGFQWSSSQGPPIHLSGGTLCTLQVVTVRQKPVALLLPFLKTKLGVD
jgi:HlyD family secretion protein